MHKKQSLRFRFILVFSVFIVAFCVSISVLAVKQTVDTASAIFDEQGLAIANRAAALIDGDAFEALAKSLDPDDPFYEETRVKLLALKNVSNCLYLYTMAGGDGAYYYVIDGSAGPDDEEHFSPLGSEEDESAYDEEFFTAWETGTAQTSGISDEEVWGWLKSVYVPVKNSAGVTVGMVGCDFQAETLIGAIRAHTLRLALMALVFIAAGFVLMYFFLGMIFNRLKSINGILKEIASGEGDLTARIAISKNDEIDEFANYFNLTLEKIRSLIGTIKVQAINLFDIGNELAAHMYHTTAAVNEITASLRNIEEKAINQSASVTGTAAAMNQVTANIGRLNGNIAEQTESVAQSSAAIEEMLANIQSVTATLVKNTENVRELTAAAGTGRTGLREVFANIKEIAKESEGILEINALMQAIAGQTNLLSMNAAIEAAHAGEAGKGFAVVADEIRKLAENSGKQSKTISGVLKKIKAEIDRITVSTNTVLEQFEAIDRSIGVVSEQETRIRGAMEEQGQGSRQILEAVGRLNEITRLVKEGSGEMLEGSKEVIKESRNLETLTGEITGGINHMASEAGQINEAVNKVNEISAGNREFINTLVTELAKFKVE
jgi:methyl-accepting chemotaxis protein